MVASKKNIRNSCCRLFFSEKTSKKVVADYYLQIKHKKSCFDYFTLHPGLCKKPQASKWCLEGRTQHNFLDFWKNHKCPIWRKKSQVLKIFCLVEKSFLKWPKKDSRQKNILKIFEIFLSPRNKEGKNHKCWKFSVRPKKSFSLSDLKKNLGEKNLKI